VTGTDSIYKLMEAQLPLNRGRDEPLFFSTYSTSRYYHIVYEFLHDNCQRVIYKSRIIQESLVITSISYFRCQFNISDMEQHDTVPVTDKVAIPVVGEVCTQ
jgi:hypothetical protein